MLALLIYHGVSASAVDDFGINSALTNMIVVRNHVDTATGKAVATARDLQALLDANPNTAVHLLNTRIEVVPDGNSTGILISSNRSLVMDDDSAIFCDSALPVPAYLPAGKYQVSFCLFPAY